MPEHVVITDPNIHEPKGVSTAASGRAYIADGAGSGSWLPVYQTDDNIVSEYRQMGVAANSTSQAIAAAGDTTLYTAADYNKWTTAWTSSYGAGTGIIFSTDLLSVVETGVYMVHVGVSCQPLASAGTGKKLALKMSINNAVGGLGAVRDVAQMDSATGLITLGVNQVLPLTAGNSISLWFASEEAIDLRVLDANVSVVRIG